MKKIIPIILIILVIIIGGSFFIWQKVSSFFVLSNEDAANKKQEQQIQSMIEERRSQNLVGDETDPFGEDGIVKILFIGLDNRLGETHGHCDAIQLIEVNKNKKTVIITAVPRGTYSPLPGKGHQPTDYYIAKACEVGGLDYGVKQIEKILGQKADYLIFMGFSQAMGIFRELDLPAEETMQWLRLRQGYAIGEPQRARNHSTFIKQMMIKFSPQLGSSINLPLGYILFKLIKTDLTFNQGLKIAQEVVKFDLPNHNERIQLLMRPAYDVQDITYDPDPNAINQYINKLLNPIAKAIPEGAYTGISLEESQQRLIENIKKGYEDSEFIRWAFDNFIWLQIDDEIERENIHFEVMKRYVNLLEDNNERNIIITDYIIEKEDLGKADWADKGKKLLRVDFPS